MKRLIILLLCFLLTGNFLITSNAVNASRNCKLVIRLDWAGKYTVTGFIFKREWKKKGDILIGGKLVTFTTYFKCKGSQKTYTVLGLSYNYNRFEIDARVKNRTDQGIPLKVQLEGIEKRLPLKFKKTINLRNGDNPVSSLEKSDFYIESYNGEKIYPKKMRIICNSKNKEITLILTFEQQNKIVKKNRIDKKEIPEFKHPTYYVELVDENENDENENEVVRRQLIWDRNERVLDLPDDVKFTKIKIKTECGDILIPKPDASKKNYIDKEDIFKEISIINTMKDEIYYSIVCGEDKQNSIYVGKIPANKSQKISIFKTNMVLYAWRDGYKISKYKLYKERKTIKIKFNSYSLKKKNITFKIKDEKDKGIEGAYVVVKKDENVLFTTMSRSGGIVTISTDKLPCCHSEIKVCILKKGYKREEQELESLEFEKEIILTKFSSFLPKEAKIKISDYINRYPLLKDAEIEFKDMFDRTIFKGQLSKLLYVPEFSSKYKIVCPRYPYVSFPERQIYHSIYDSYNINVFPESAEVNIVLKFSKKLDPKKTIIKLDKKRLKFDKKGEYWFSKGKVLFKFDERLNDFKPKTLLVCNPLYKPYSGEIRPYLKRLEEKLISKITLKNREKNFLILLNANLNRKLTHEQDLYEKAFRILKDIKKADKYNKINIGIIRNTEFKTIKSFNLATLPCFSCPWNPSKGIEEAIEYMARTYKPDRCGYKYPLINVILISYFRTEINIENFEKFYKECKKKNPYINLIVLTDKDWENGSNKKWIIYVSLDQLRSKIKEVIQKWGVKLKF